MNVKRNHAVLRCKRCGVSITKPTRVNTNNMVSGEMNRQSHFSRVFVDITSLSKPLPDLVIDHIGSSVAPSISCRCGGVISKTVKITDEGIFVSFPLFKKVAITYVRDL